VFMSVRVEPVKTEAKIALWKLRLGMLGTFTAVVAVTTLILTGILTALGLPFYGVYGILVFVLFIHLLQWLIGPYIIDAVYHVRPLEPGENPWLEETVRKLSIASGLRKPPKIMIAEISIPNAFAYGSPLTGDRVAVTRGLLETLPRDEVEAVLGHELGHLKHKDVLVMMMISIIPALVYYIGYTLYVSGWFGGGREERGGTAYLFLAGIALMVLSYILNLFVFYMSRLREYYADAHAALTVHNGARRLQRALARIMYYTGFIRRRETYNQFKAFFISDPDVGIRVRYIRNIDDLVEMIKREKPSILADILSTHPHPAKRLRYLDKFI